MLGMSFAGGAKRAEDAIYKGLSIVPPFVTLTAPVGGTLRAAASRPFFPKKRVR